jgi:hypothetical protein
VRMLLHAMGAVVLSMPAASALAIAGLLHGGLGPWEGSAAMQSLRWVAAETTGIELAVSEGGPIHLGAGPTLVRLLPSAEAGQLAKRIRTLPSSDQVYLVLQGINTNTPPSITYNLFLSLPDTAAASSGPTDPHYVGTLNFFDSSPSRSVVFNVTDKIRTFGAAGVLGDRPTVTIIPAGLPESGAEPSVNKVKLVAIKR